MKLSLSKKMKNIMTNKVAKGAVITVTVVFVLIVLQFLINLTMPAKSELNSTFKKLDKKFLCGSGAKEGSMTDIDIRGTSYHAYYLIKFNPNLNETLFKVTSAKGYQPSDSPYTSLSATGFSDMTSAFRKGNTVITYSDQRSRMFLACSKYNRQYSAPYGYSILELGARIN